jgi:molybdopterin-binding protein
MQKRVFRTNLDVAQIVEGHVNSNVMATVPERCFLLSVLIVAKRLQYRLSPVETGQSIVEIVTRQGVTGISTKKLIP